MSTRFARLAFGSAARRTQSASARVSRRAMSSTSHGAQATSNDKPWIIGSTLVFLPLFLYLVSPSARKTEHLAHDDRHDFPTLKHKEVPAPKPASEPAPQKEEAPAQLLADDEGTLADVGASVAAAEGADAPKAAQEAETQAATIAEAEGAPVDSVSSELSAAAPEVAAAKQEA